MSGAPEFREEYLQKYGLRINSRSPDSGRVTALLCRFCESFGRERNESLKRKPSQSVKTWSKTFRSDHIQNHLKSQHRARWDEYRIAGCAERNGFFRGRGAEVLISSEEEKLGVQRIFSFDRKIVEGIISELLLENDRSGERALAPFQLQLSEEDGNFSGDREMYIAKVSNGALFSLAIGVVSLGLSFRAAARTLEFFRRKLGLAEIGFCDSRKPSMFARVVCAANLQKISDILKEAWAFSVALDASNKGSTSYLDVRIRIGKDGRLHNLHLLAIPMKDTHTGKHMYELLVKVLDALASDWRLKVIGVSTDGARSMTGCHSGVATRLEKDALPGFYRVWCASHQLNLVVQENVKVLCNERFLDTLTSLIGHLRRQQSPIAEMGTTCPRFSDTRWLSIGKVIKWLLANRVRVRNHLEEKKPPCKPNLDWWAVLSALDKIFRSIEIVMTRLQGMNTLLCEQRVELDELVVEICGFADMKGPLSKKELTGLDRSKFLVCGNFAITLENAKGYLEDLGTHVVRTLEAISKEDRMSVISGVANFLVRTVHGISNIVAERNTSNRSGSPHPPVMPHSLAQIRGRSFGKIFQDQIPPLHHSFSEEQAEKIEQEHIALVEASTREHALRNALERCTSRTRFEDGWALLGERFPLLRTFSEGLATVFPGTSTVESDFSLISFEKGEYRSGLTNFSLEGILHAKQFERLQAIPTN